MCNKGWNPMNKNSPSRKDVFTLLRLLKNLKADYPPKLLASRRAAFQKQIAEVTQKKEDR
jgi:hypothetical protein